MIYSMTAFARSQQQGEYGQLTCEIRSINHRYLEMGVNLPESLRNLEMMIREQLRSRVKRGKLECTIRFQAQFESNQGVSINADYVRSICNAAESISKLLTHPANISPTDILRVPGVLESREIDLKPLEAAVSKLLNETITDLLAARAREGEELKNHCVHRMTGISSELAKIAERLPVVQAEQQARLHQRFADAQVDLDPQRLAQEMVFFAQKIDVSEEMDRAKTHLLEMERVFKEGGLVGRRLDFLIQELHREANTLGSKSVDATLMHAVVEMKVLIEQMREQVQNIE